MLNIAAGFSQSGYNLTRSLRFRASASAYLSRTPSVLGNQKTFTISTWMKRGTLNSAGNVGIAVAGVGAGDANRFMFVNDQLYLDRLTGGGAAWSLQTTQVFRDPSAWYHIVLAVDTTQATAANRVKMYVNGVLVTSFASASYPAQNDFTYFNLNGALHRIGLGDLTPTYYFDGYQAELNWVDGQQLPPSSFGSFNSTTGVWQPAKYTGTYGTNGFYLPFTDNSALTTSSNVGLGKDFSGNGNYWVTNNISITSGVTYDSMTDVPTLTSATAANFAVLNPLDSASGVLTNGNLQFTSGGNAMSRASIAMPAGKWYAEVTFTSGSQANIGIATSSANLASYLGSDAYGWGYAASGVKINNNTTAGYGATFTTGDVIGITFDTSNGQLTFYKNNVSQGVAYTVSTTGTYFFALGTGSCGNAINFGQRPFAYTPPTGFVALNAYNLPTATILKGNTVMDATLYTGNGSTQTITNAAGFKPDLVWVKSRSLALEHKESNSIRGATKATKPNSTDPETIDTNGITAFNSNGFSLGSDANYNTSSATYDAWQWQAGQGSSSSNTSGTITSTVSVNANAGFSILTFNGTGANATVGHGLGISPSMFIVKNLTNAAGNWAIGHIGLTSLSGYAIYLNSTAAQFAAGTFWNSLAPTSSVLNLGASPQVNESAQPMMAQVWAEIAGFSKFGVYTGNGSADGTFIYTGFKPKVVWIKSRDGATGWRQYDTSRSPSNLTNLFLQSSSSAAEQTTGGSIDMLSNGFKIRDTDTSVNGNASAYIYAAFASNPFKNSLAQ